MARSTEFVPDNEVDSHWTIFRAPIITGIKGTVCSEGPEDDWKERKAWTVHWNLSKYPYFQDYIVLLELTRVN